MRWQWLGRQRHYHYHCCAEQFSPSSNKRTYLNNTATDLFQVLVVAAAVVLPLEQEQWRNGRIDTLYSLFVIVASIIILRRTRYIVVCGYLPQWPTTVRSVFDGTVQYSMVFINTVGRRRLIDCWFMGINRSMRKNVKWRGKNSIPLHSHSHTSKSWNQALSIGENWWRFDLISRAMDRRFIWFGWLGVKWGERYY